MFEKFLVNFLMGNSLGKIALSICDAQQRFFQNVRRLLFRPLAVDDNSTSSKCGDLDVKNFSERKEVRRRRMKKRSKRSIMWNLTKSTLDLYELYHHDGSIDKDLTNAFLGVFKFLDKLNVKPKNNSVKGSDVINSVNTKQPRKRKGSSSCQNKHEIDISDTPDYHHYYDYMTGEVHTYQPEPLKKVVRGSRTNK